METAGETCVPSNPIPNGSVWGATGATTVAPVRNAASDSCQRLSAESSDDHQRSSATTLDFAEL